MAFQSRTTFTPLLLTYKNESMYLHIDPQECALFSKDKLEPVYRIQEPLLLAQGIMTDSETVHLVVLKTNGELCYTLISESGTPQTSLLAKLDVRATKYRRLFLFPQGKMIHIFYSYTHQSIPNLWRIEHRYWDGASWHSVHLGEVVHPREPLYHVNLDSQGNIHLLTMTFQGRHSLLFSNRFNGTFHLWGSPTETLKISGEVVDMAALMTSDNVHTLFWVVKTPTGQFELRWAQQPDAHELASAWHPSPAPIKTLSSPWKSIGALEKNGVLWLLAHTGEEVLMLNDGKGWKLVSSSTSFHRPLQWMHKEEKNFHQTYWLEDQVEQRAPAYFSELGLSITKRAAPLPTPFQPIPAQAISPTPPPVPAFYPEQLSSNPFPLASITEDISPTASPELNVHELNTPNLPETKEPEAITNQIPYLDETLSTPAPSEVPKVLENPSDQVLQSQPLKKNAELEHLIETVALLEQENTQLHPLIETVSLLQQENSKLHSLTDTVALLQQENSKLHSLTDTVALLQQENSKLHSLTDTVALLQQENSKLHSLTDTVALLQQENSKLHSLSDTVALLQQENTKLHSLTETVSLLQQENTKLHSLTETVSLLQQENTKLHSLSDTVALLQQENTIQSLALHDMLSKFNQILGTILENVTQPKQPKQPRQPKQTKQAKQKTSSSKESRQPQPIVDEPLEELMPLQETMSDPEHGDPSLSQALPVMAKMKENASSLEKLELQIDQLLAEKEDVKGKGGFWNKWFS